MLQQFPLVASQNVCHCPGRMDWRIVVVKQDPRLQRQARVVSFEWQSARIPAVTVTAPDILRPRRYRDGLQTSSRCEAVQAGARVRRQRIRFDLRSRVAEVL
ncbi:hypothetical protein RRG08_065998 [Elysia crispata]|uniref:Uncharacterized protein n=1 Tax=Elysia crispata TaxID=231223 RepID=A0AAE1AMB5_9GAST|nr:hypothetical protein RRG08_065998 [Elysia crispata]